MSLLPPSVEGYLMQAIGLHFPFEIGKRTLVRHYVKRVLEGVDKPLEGGSDRVVVTRAGVTFELETSEEIDLWIYLTGWWEKTDCRIALAALRPGDTVLDVGAHIGFFSVHAARIVGPRGRVYGFEPNPHARSRSLRNARLNGLQNMFVEATAIGDRVGEGRLFLPNAGHTGDSSLFERSLRDGNDSRSSRRELDRTQNGDSSEKPLPPLGRATVSVSIVPLDTYCHNHGIDSVEFIKFDIEGSEPAALLGARETLASYRPRLMVECNKRALTAAGWKVADFLTLIWDLDYYTLKRGFCGTRLRPVIGAADIESDMRDVCNLHCIPRH
jgi:FkbM family methyltransferase